MRAKFNKLMTEMSINLTMDQALLDRDGKKSKCSLFRMASEYSWDKSKNFMSKKFLKILL